MAHTFHVGTPKNNPLDTLIVMSDDAFVEMDYNDFPSNISNWEHITVASEEDKAAFIGAKSAWLDAAWTPNQDEDERKENAKKMKECEAEMERLAIQ